MNSDFCHEQSAEENVENFLKNALSFDEKNPDALIQLSNLRILRCRDKEAIEILNILFNQIEINLNNNKIEDLPNHDLLTNISKNFIELEIYDKAAKVFDLLTKQDDENIEFWYLISFCHFKLKNYNYSMKCLKNVKKTREKIKKNDKEIEEASYELYLELEKIKINNNGI